MTLVSASEILSALMEQYNQASVDRNVPELIRLAEVYRGLGYEQDADYIERRLEHLTAVL